MIGSFFLRSQTTHLEENVEASMCCTCLFHAIDNTSSCGVGLAPTKMLNSNLESNNIDLYYLPGVIGALVLFISQI